MTTGAEIQTSPQPQQFATSTPGIGGAIKSQPDDFIVEELPLYEPCGEGEHLYLFVESRNVAHATLIETVARQFGVKEKAIGFAGMKDKVAVTRQLVSVHLPGSDHEPVDEIEDDRMRILWADRHTNKLRRGHLQGNRFSIRIRDVDPLKVTTARQTLTQLERTGVPNYFGSQRFGYRLSNQILGACALRQAWQELLDELLGTTGSPYPEHQQQRRECYDQGRYREALDLCSPNDRAERQALRRLLSGADAKQVVKAISRQMLIFWIHALQSAVFNRVVDERIASGRFTDLIVGDLAWLHGGRAVFAVTDEELASGELPERLNSLEISPSGPLWGKRMIQPAGEVLHLEQQACAAHGITAEAFGRGPLAAPGERRPLRCPLRNAGIDGGVDDHGGMIRVTFDLERGSYATIVLREIMKT